MQFGDNFIYLRLKRELYSLVHNGLGLAYGSVRSAAHTLSNSHRTIFTTIINNNYQLVMYEKVNA